MSRVEDVLAAHLFTLYPGEIVCDCEWSDRDDKGTRAGDNRMIAAHCTHVAAALAAAGIGDTAAAEARGAQAVLNAVERIAGGWPHDYKNAARRAARNVGAPSESTAGLEVGGDAPSARESARNAGAR